MNKRTQAILDKLDEQYGVDVVCHLHYKEPWQLLIATILSAQCTDARVNLVTPELFQKYIRRRLLKRFRHPSIQFCVPH